MSDKAARERDAPSPAAPAPHVNAPAPVAAPDTPIAAVQALQRGAGNQAVSRWLAGRATLAREGTAPAAPPSGVPKPAAPVAREDHVFLMGDAAADAFYAEARGYYAQTYPKAAIHDVRTLSEILAQVKQAKAPIGHLLIVSHAHEDGTLMFKLDANDKDNRLDYGELKKANDDGTMPTVDQKIVDDQTSIEIRGCNIGRSPLMLNQLDKAFGGKAKVTAPTHEQHYSHDASGTYHEDFSGYFVEEPGKRTKTDKELQPLFAAKYPFVEAKQWPALLKKKSVFNDRQPAYGIDVLMPEPAGAVAAFDASLDEQLPKADGWSFKLLKRTPVGGGFQYDFEASRLHEGKPEKRTVKLDAAAPRTADLEALARADLSRPDAYEYKDVQTAFDPASGNKAFNLYPERTEWRIRHEVIKDAQGPYRPAGTDKGYWGESDFAPPPDPP